MHRTLLLPMCVLVFALSPAAAQAQRITVQEPSLETFGVGTTVSVPDRGRASVAGVGRGAMSRNTFGPFRSGTNMGLSNQATSSGVDVQIQDLAELDQRALNAAARIMVRRGFRALHPPLFPRLGTASAAGTSRCAASFQTRRYVWFMIDP